MIKIKRDSGFTDRGRAYKVVLDGGVVGKIKNGEEIELINPATGKHELYLKIDWCRSNKVIFENNSETIEFACGSNLRGFRILFGILYLTLLYNRYIWLKNKSELSG